MHHRHHHHQFQIKMLANNKSEEARIKVMLARKDHTDKTLNARFHPHQAQAVTGSADKSVLVWNVTL